MRHLKSAFAALGIATVLVLAANTVTQAATGQGFLLGKSNSADNITALTRTTDGSALKLQTKSSASAPLTVNGKGVVTNLNADSIDGYNSTLLRDRTYVFTDTFTEATNVSYNLPLAAGSYLVTVSTFFEGINASSGIECAIVEDKDAGDDITTGWESQNYVFNDSWRPALSASGYATKSATQDIRVSCDTNGGEWEADASSPLTITATPTTIASKKDINTEGGIIFKQKK